MKNYDHKRIEKKWQEKWESEDAYQAVDNAPEGKDYLMIEFPYPSGDGLHVGHVRSWTALDVVARKRRAQGRNVLYPIGWDAFGLPTENYALKTGKDPRIVTKENTDNFRRQIKSLGLSFDWSREINTTDPSYYKWTQWIFLRLYEKGLAYKAKTLINWCPKDKIGLANEEVIDGCCERCGTPVVKREKEQWMLAITKYAQRLYDDLDTVDYIERAKTQQRNWIGPSEGAEIEFAIKDSGHKIKVFTTRADTIFGATYMVLAPEHPLVSELKDHLSNKNEVTAYQIVSKNKSDIDRTSVGREKTGEELKGIKAINPATMEEIPIFIADYVLSGYGTGAIMAVPGHDERDFTFAQKYKLPIKNVVQMPKNISIKQVVRGTGVGNWVGHPEVFQVIDDDSGTYLGELYKNLGQEFHNLNGLLENSGQFSGIANEEAKKKITEFVGGKTVTTFKLRDWIFSRQRYWGEPIPMIHCPKCGIVPVPEDQLPVVLPQVEKYQPTDTGESPLANITEWVNVKCPKCDGDAKRETDVMPNWAGSSWYYLRYTDPKNDEAFASQDLLKYWTPVDWYNGGMEHTVLHLLYSRFWHKFLFDEGLVPTSEPYMKRTSHGLILAEDGSKMSKSKGNTVSPDTLVAAVGADSLRLYEMFLGPFDQPVSWNNNGVVGMRRFLERVADLAVSDDTEPKSELETLMHQTVKKVTDDIENLKMNTAVSALMILLNECEKEDSVPRDAYEILLKLLAPFAPHLTHELWEQSGHQTELRLEKWPVADESKLKGTTAHITIQINGKMRGDIQIGVDTDKSAVENAAREAVAKYLEGKTVSRVVVVPNRLVNFVVTE
jgi:leucyl-tRNA synthetase